MVYGRDDLVIAKPVELLLERGGNVSLVCIRFSDDISKTKKVMVFMSSQAPRCLSVANHGHCKK